MEGEALMEKRKIFLFPPDSVFGSTGWGKKLSLARKQKNYSDEKKILISTIEKIWTRFFYPFVKIFLQFWK